MPIVSMGMFLLSASLVPNITNLYARKPLIMYFKQ